MSGTDHEQQRIAEGPAIILVEPQLGENIGMVARAMANFGLAELRIVAPRDGWPNERARAAASGADYIVEAASVHDDLAGAVADLSFLYATTARPRDMIKPVLGPVEAAQRLRAEFNSGAASGLMFGRERWGLTNDEIALAHAIVTFPVNPAFASLNIAQAVLLMAYEWLKTRPQTQDEARRFASEGTPASRQDLAALMTHLERALDDADYFHPPERRERMRINLQGILTHAGWREEEIRTMHGVIAALERRWLKGRAGGEGSGSA